MMRHGIAVMTIGLLAVQVHAGEVSALKTPMDKTSYSLGVDLGQKLKQQGAEINPEILSKGLRDGLSGEKLLMTEDDVRATVRSFQAEFRKRHVLNNRMTALDNKQAGDAFMAENKKKEGVVSLPSGLQYKIVKAGEGRKAVMTDAVECRYRGTLIDGTEVDSSAHGNTPAILKVAEVIPGWKEALLLMPVGAHWQLFVPPELAYGVRGKGAAIGPNATLIFDLELLAVK